MPNIEVHGFGRGKEGEQMRENIFWLFDDKPYVDEMVVTLFSTNVRDKNKKAQPFFRLVNSCQEHSEEIIRMLQEQFGLDVEHLQLVKFYPKPKKTGAG